MEKVLFEGALSKSTKGRLVEEVWASHYCEDCECDPEFCDECYPDNRWDFNITSTSHITIFDVGNALDIIKEHDILCFDFAHKVFMEASSGYGFKHLVVYLEDKFDSCRVVITTTNVSKDKFNLHIIIEKREK